jgi:uncharacterized membrane protein
MNRWLLTSIVLTILAAAVSGWLWFVRPDLLSDPLPVHWNAAGQVDHTVPLAEAGLYLFLAPLAMAGLVLLTLVLPWLSPRKFEIDRFRATYHYVMFLVTALFAYLNAALLLAYLKDPPLRLDVGTLIVGGMFLFFALLGRVMAQVTPNFYVGVRTPWTLASETVWTRTHELTGWIWTMGGVAGLVVVAAAAVVQTAWQVNMPWLFMALFVAFMIMALFPVPYSLVLYKRLEREGKLEPAEK